MKINIKKVLIALFVLLLIPTFFFIPFPFKLEQPSVGQAESLVKTVKAAPPLAALDDYLGRLVSDGRYPSQQAVLIEKLDGEVLAEYNADTPLNPASVIKLAVSYLVLKHFGPEHRFKTVAYTTGVIDEAKQTLYGDLVIESDGDPNFRIADAVTLANSIRSQGIKRIEGELLVKGPMRLRHSSSSEYAFNKLKTTLGLTFPKAGATLTRTVEPLANNNAEPKRILLGEHFSAPLKELLLYMNAHSDNYYAEQLGRVLGGPEVVQEELLAEFRLRPEALYISHTSGLNYNRITPRALLAILQKTINLLKGYDMRIENIMPVAGVDSGTLILRLRQPGMMGGVVAKTGTLTSTDNGVSTLAGVIYSERYGPLLFAIFNMGGGVHYFRHHQDLFLSQAMAELGSNCLAVRSENILAPEQPEEEVASRSVRKRRATYKPRRARR
ncbi:MAG: D-alanyl-D-alanine carboxypeptidase [Acidobacteriota bacterium]